MMPRGKGGRTARSVPVVALAALGLAVACGSGLALGTGPAAAQTKPGAAQAEPAAAETATYEGKAHRYTVTLPAGCRYEEGPGTVDAICAPDFNPEKSAVANAATALLLGVAAESLDGAGDTSVTGLLQRYTEAGFKEELPEAICGEQDRTRVKIENLSQSVEDERLIYTADVMCADVRFLQIGARHALVRHVIGPEAVYRLVARAPVEEFDRQRATVDAFFASFRLSGAEKAEK
jgi:hypothetical protein